MNLPHYGWVILYGFLALANALWTFRYHRRGEKGKQAVGVIFGGVFLVLGVLSAGALLYRFTVQLGIWIDAIFSLPVLSICLWAMIFLAWWQASVFCRPEVIWTVGNLAALLLSFWLSTPAGAARLRRAEDMAVLGALVVTAGFLGCGLRLAALNDRRRREGQPVWEQVFSQKVPTWPDLVYIELICMLFVLAGLLVWSLLAPAPLEAPANPAITPNPAKAPWYFVGLQELLVYFDATFAGVILPGLMIVGLLLLPFLDPNPRGNGYYTLKERPLATAIFLLGFLGLWWYLIFLGTFLRGANWSYVPPFQSGELPLTVGTTRSLSEVFWTEWLGVGLGGQEQSGCRSFAMILIRESPGLVLLFLYFWVLPVVAARGVLRPLRSQLGRARYWLVCFLILMMLAIPVKMLLRWLCHLNYLVAMPEYRFNF
jgi:hypothetical protein